MLRYEIEVVDTYCPATPASVLGKTNNLFARTFYSPPRTPALLFYSSSAKKLCLKFKDSELGKGGKASRQPSSLMAKKKSQRSMADQCRNQGPSRMCRQIVFSPFADSL